MTEAELEPACLPRTVPKSATTTGPLGKDKINCIGDKSTTVYARPDMVVYPPRLNFAVKILKTIKSK